ncbi:MAG: molecular chaperone TorD family protein [Candidatus Omnitrophica bacterium]|nr:molecular chaperone TorD family protein [Candidatus Omnitrophota bacterium]
MPEIKEIHKTAELLARSTLYRALAFLFRHPGKEHLELLWKKSFREWLDAVQILDTSKEGFLIKASEALNKELEKISLQEWTREHERIFGHAAYGSTPPYELEYGEEHSHRQPHELGDIAAFYQAFGLKIAHTVHERVDHVAVECDFLHFLTFKEAYALEHDGEEKAEICRDASTRFLADHLSRWLPVFTLRVAKQTRASLHRAIADFALAFILEECRALGIKPGPQDLPLRALEKQEETSCTACPLKETDGNYSPSI